MTIDTTFHITGILLGSFLSVIFMGYMTLTFFEEGKRGGATASQRFAGIFSLILGLAVLSTWAYFLLSQWNLFWTEATALSVHVLSELVSAITLIVAGIALLRAWSRAPALFMIANGSLLFTAILALSAYDMKAHTILMNGATSIMMIVAVYMVGLVYGWEHFVLHVDEREPSKKRQPRIAKLL